jgi:hypothetical protein
VLFFGFFLAKPSFKNAILLTKSAPALFYFIVRDRKLSASVTHLDLGCFEMILHLYCPSSFAAPQKPRCQILSKND